MNTSNSINQFASPIAIQQHLPPKIQKMLAPFAAHIGSVSSLQSYQPERTFSGVQVIVPENHDSVMIVVGKHFAFQRSENERLVRETPCETFVWQNGKAQDHTEPKIISEYAESRELVDDYHNDCSRIYLQTCLKHLARVGKFHRIVADMPFSKVERVYAQLFAREFKGYEKKIDAIVQKTGREILAIAFKAWEASASEG